MVYASRGLGEPLLCWVGLTPLIYKTAQEEETVANDDGYSQVCVCVGGVYVFERKLFLTVL